MSGETLRIQTFDVTNTTITPGSDESHVIDAALKTENAPYLLMTEEVGQTYKIVWSSSDDEPEGDLEFRSKLAEVTYDAQGLTNFVQQTWDLRVNIPENNSNNRLTGGVFEDTNQLIIAAGGNVEDTAISAIDLDADPPEAYPSYIDGQAVIYYPDSEPYPGVKPRNEVVWDSGSFVKLNDGRILYVWSEVDNDSAYGDQEGPFALTSIRQGYADDLATFISQDNSIQDEVILYEDLRDAECSVWRSPVDDNLYLCIAFRNQQGTEYWSSPDSRYPQTRILQSTDEGETWSDYSELERIDWVTAHTWDFGAQFKSRTVGIPTYLESGRIVFPCVAWKEETHFGSQVHAPQPGIWISDDDGLTWTLTADLTYGVATSQTGPAGRHVVEWDDRLWWQAGSAGVVEAAGGKAQIWYSTDEGATWIKQMDEPFNNFEPYLPYYGMAFFVEPSGALCFWEGGKIYRYSEDGPQDAIPDQDADLVANYTVDPSTVYNIDSFPGGVVIKIDSYWLFYSKGRLIAAPESTATDHLGVHALIIDNCSKDDYNPFEEE